MIPIHRIKITNYQGIEEVVLYDLKKINVFIGKNNSGKSSILKAIVDNNTDLKVDKYIDTKKVNIEDFLENKSIHDNLKNAIFQKWNLFKKNYNDGILIH